MTPSELARVTLSSADGTVVAEILGEVDPSNARDIGRKLTEAVPNDALAVVIDLSGVTFLDSAGLSALATAHRAARAADRALRIRCGTARAVVRPLQITGLWDVFTIVQDR